MKSSKFGTVHSFTCSCQECKEKELSVELPQAPHYHTDERGTLVKCYHKSKAMVLSWEFWFASMIGFPIEHAFWDYVPPFKYLTKFFGL